MPMSCITLEKENQNNPKLFKKQSHHSFHSHLLFYLTKTAQAIEEKHDFWLSNPNYYQRENNKKRAEKKS